MSFSKAVDLLRLAMMATSRQGVCLSDVEAEFGGVRRTAQRMIAALEEGRRFIGGDLGARQTDGRAWVDVAADLWAARQRQGRLF